MTWGSSGANCWALYGKKQYQVSHQWLSDPLCDMGLQHAICAGCHRAQCQGFCLAPLGRVPRPVLTARAEAQGQGSGS